MAEIPTGSLIAGCRIEGIVGRGGMGVVYRATQLSLERPVALKAIAPEYAGDVTFRERFKRESRIAASIEHPNVIPVYEAGEGEGVLYLIMRYVEGTDLRAVIDAASGGLEPERATTLVAQVASALAAAHRRDLIHRDVKPANVLIDAGGEPEHAYLTDFGIARHSTATSGLTHTGAVIGTMDYLAPERIQDQGGDGRADVYALGCVLFEALTGARPYERDNDVAKMYAHLSAPVPSARELRPELPAELDAVAQRAMAKDPDDRYASAGEMAAALTDTLPSRPPTVPGPAAAPAVLPPTEPVSARAVEEPAPPRVEETTAPLEETTAQELTQPPAELAPAEPAPEAVPPTEIGPTKPVPPRAAPPVTPPPPAAAPPATPPPPAATPPPATPATPPPSPPATPPPSAKPRRRIPATAIGVVVAAVAGAALVLTLAGNDDPADENTSTNSTGQETTQTQTEGTETLAFRKTATIRIPTPGADGMAVGEGSVWLADKETDQVIPIPVNGRSAGTAITVGDEPDSVAVGFGSVWVSNTSSGDVSRIDPAAGEQIGRIVTAAGPEGIAVSEDAVWVANFDDDSVTRISPKGVAEGTTKVGDGPVQLAVADDGIWVTLAEENKVVELDPETGEPTGKEIAVSGQPRGIAFGDGRIWVSALQDAKLTIFDPADPAGTKEQLDVPAGPRELRFGLGAMWLNSSTDGRLTAIDPETLEEVAGFDVGKENYGLAVNDRFAWSSSLAGQKVTKVAPQ
jgi:serine/threonine-protein kinase